MSGIFSSLTVSGSSLNSPDGSIQNALQVDNAGRVKVGLSGESQLTDLHVLTLGATATLRLSTGGTGNTGGFEFSIGTTFDIRGKGNNDMLLFTNNTEKMRITADGKVGIGTSTPHTDLQFSNAVQNRKIVLFEAGNDDHRFSGFGISPLVLRYQVPTDTSDHVFYSGLGNSASRELLRIEGDGNVGIGETVPLSRLHVKDGDSGVTSLNVAANNFLVESDGNTGMTIAGGSSTSGSIYFADPNDDDVGRIIYFHSGNQMAFGVNGNTEFVIGPNQNFGFGELNNFGSGQRVIAIKDAVVTPSVNPVGGGILYVENGALKFRGSSGTVTTIANA